MGLSGKFDATSTEPFSSLTNKTIQRSYSDSKHTSTSSRIPSDYQLAWNLAKIGIREPDSRGWP
ncbi:predicted protein [Plenodomus lingam JN3]|uniref:Predicted protein n=1 Tax=Leptosphaeria maculans (strain JN3 / isolate v23.1.3 / race Av1-4-5-6-7-8) TaxID=985895 RepID=E4ZI56_LEPMJ|nr:predicted protein [Plenodomus lingam JN3]CBX91199.1 predicted protein [Plenodomus lingam JN3]